MSNNVLLPGAQSQFPPWFDAQAQELGLDPFNAANMFIHWLNSPEGAGANAGPYWSQFAPGGALAGQGIDSVDPRFQFGGSPSGPGPGPDPNRTPTDPNGIGSAGANPAQHGGAGWSATVPTRPTAPPNGAGPGSWVLRGNNAYGYQWQWNEREHRTPPADALPPGFDPAPDQPPPPPVKPKKPPAGGPPLTGNAPPVDPFNYYSVAHTGPRQGGAGPGGPPARTAAALQPNQRPRLTPAAAPARPPGAGPGGARPTGPQPRPRRPSTITGGDGTF